MDIEIGYYPKKYYLKSPTYTGLFPFAFDVDIPYVLEFGNIYLPTENNEWIFELIRNINGFPLFFCLESTIIQFEENYRDLIKYGVKLDKINMNEQHVVSLIYVENLEQLQKVFPDLILYSCNGWNVLWSTNKNVFKIQKKVWLEDSEVKDTVSFEIEKGITVFWLGYDVNNIAVLSANDIFSTFENIRKVLPKSANFVFENYK